MILKKHLADKLQLLCLDCNQRYNTNPLRILDCKICYNLEFPSYKKTLDQNDLDYLKKLNYLLDNLKIEHNYNENLIRGLDYYTGMVFELTLKNNNDKSVILGGGRYDQLFQQLGKT